MSLSISLPSSIKDESTFIILHDLKSLLLYNLTFPIYNLSLDQQNCIKIFIQNSPEIFEKITKDINDIYKDGKIDLYDVPFIIQLLVDTYQLYNVNNTLLNSENVFVFETSFFNFSFSSFIFFNSSNSFFNISLSFLICSFSCL